MARIPAADDPHDALAPDDPAEFAHRLDRRFHFHPIHTPLEKKTNKHRSRGTYVDIAFSSSDILYSNFDRK
jgi:hypothetical protein